jgi:hypothetical protein
MKAQGADPVAIRLQQDRVHNASAAIDDFCEETGRTRLRERETAPVRATWPGEQANVERYQGGYTPTINTPAPTSSSVTNTTQVQEQEQPQSEKRNGLREMTEDENAAVESYVSGDAMYINQMLRGRMDGETMSAEERELVDDLDSALDVPLGKNQTLYRSVDAEAVFGRISQIDYDNLRGAVIYGDKSKIVQQTADSYISKTQGKTITELGYMSTTKDEKVAHEWGGFTGSDKPIVLEFTAPPNIHGRDLERFEVEGSEQSEVLLMRGQKYHVTSIKGKNGNIVVHADLLEK